MQTPEFLFNEYAMKYAKREGRWWTFEVPSSDKQQEKPATDHS